MTVRGFSCPLNIYLTFPVPCEFYFISDATLANFNVHCIFRRCTNSSLDSSMSGFMSVGNAVIFKERNTDTSYDRAIHVIIGYR